MPEIEMDDATHYVYKSGFITCKVDTAETVANYKTGIMNFMDALAEAADLGATSSPMDTTITRFSVSPSMYDFTFSVKNEAQDPSTGVKPVIVIDMINDSYYRIEDVFPSIAIIGPCFLYWVIYKSKPFSMGENLTTSDVFVSMAYETQDAFTNRGISGPGYGDDNHLVDELLDDMARNTAFTFGFVSVVDSIYEGGSAAGYRGILIPNASGGWVDDSSSDVGRVINGRVSLQQECGEKGGLNYSSSLLLTSDSPLYPSSGVKNGSFGNICPAIYLTPAWSPSSRCISVNTRTLQWGGLLEESTESGESGKAAHYGPQYVSMGSNYYLRCLDTYVPVDAIT